MHDQHSHCSRIAADLSLTHRQVEKTAALLAEGATVPFIARYRKEITGSLDEVAVTRIRDGLESLAELEKRRFAIVDSLTKRELLTEDLQARLASAVSLAVLEDIYLPVRPKRRTRGMIAEEKGLRPLAQALFSGKSVHPELFIDSGRDVASADDALAGARDIIAEWINEDPPTRSGLRSIFTAGARITSKVVKKKEAEAEKFRDYFDWQELAGKTPGHRLLALFRGENEKFLTLSIRPPEEEPLRYLHKLYAVNARNAGQMSLAAADCYRRLLAPSLENELRRELKQAADKEAIGVFAANIRTLLLSPPLGRKSVLALDPGFRTGAKLACLDETGRLLHHETIFPTHGGEKLAAAARIVTRLVQKFSIKAIAIGDGTAGRET